MRNATAQGAANSTSAGAQAAQIKAGEQEAAMNMGANMLNTQRSQDLSSMGQANQMAGTYFGGLESQDQAGLQAGEAMNALNSSNYNTAMGLNQETSAQNAQANQAMLSGITSSAGALLAMSDGTQKKDVSDASGGSGSPFSDSANPLLQFSRGYSGKGGSEHSESSKLHDKIDPKKQKEALDARAAQAPLKAYADPSGKPAAEDSLYTGQAPSLGQAAADPRVNWMVPEGATGEIATNPMTAVPNGAPSMAQVSQPGFGMDQSPTTFQPQAYNPNFAVSLPPNVTSDANAKMAAHAAGMQQGVQMGHALGQQSAVDKSAGLNGINDQFANAQKALNQSQMMGRTGSRGGVVQAVTPVNKAAGLNGIDGQFQNAQRALNGQPVAQNFRVPTSNLQAGPQPTAAISEGTKGSPFAGNARPMMQMSQAAPAPQMMAMNDAPQMSSIYSDGNLKEDMDDGSMQMVGDLGQSKPAPQKSGGGPMSMLGGMGGMMGGGAGGAGAGAAAGEDAGMAADVMSDEHNKDGIGAGDMTEADHFLATLKPYSYKYKDPQNEPRSEPTGGRYLGVMAQNVEQAPDVGRQIVKDTPRGKVLEGGAMMSAMAAGMGRLHERVAQLESKRLKTGTGLEGK